MRILYAIGFVMAIAWPCVRGGQAQPQLQPFVDVARDVGIDLHNAYMTVGWADVDRDGWLDAYLGIEGWNGRLIARPNGIMESPRSVNGSWNRLYRNEGGKILRDTTRRSGVINLGDVVDVAWGDYDNDGWVDLYCSNADTTGMLFHSEGNGTFREVTVVAGVLDTAWGGAGAAWADYDLDGWLDLYVAKLKFWDAWHTEGISRLYRNKRDGTFEEVARAAGVERPGGGVAWADYDRDSWLDLVVTHSLRFSAITSVWVYHNRRDGTFQEVGEAVGIGAGLKRTGVGNNVFGRNAVAGVAWGDYDNDGWVDLVIAGLDSDHEVYRNLGDGTFQWMRGIGIHEQSGLDPAWGDIDNDGWLDLLLVGGEGVRSLYVNHRDGTFREMAQQLGLVDESTSLTNTESAAWGDYDHDGFLDVILMNSDNGYGSHPIQLFQNPGNGNHWLIVQPVGMQSNRSAIGAKVWVVVGTQRQLREIDGGSGLGSHTLAGAAFGMGAAARVDSLLVEWPSGQVDAWTDLAVDQAIEVAEGQAPAFRVRYGTGTWQLNQPLASPAILPQGQVVSVHLTVRVVSPMPGRRPDRVTVDLRTIGGAGAVALRDDGQAGDTRAGDGIYSRVVRVAPTVPAGEYGLLVTVRDAAGQPQGSTAWIHLRIWPQDRAIYTDSVATGWQVDAYREAISDIAAPDHVYRGRVAHRLLLGGPKASVVYRAVDSLGVSVWGAQALECWVWGATAEAVRGLTVSGLGLGTLGVRPVARRWLRVRVPIQQVIKVSQLIQDPRVAQQTMGLADRVLKVVFGRVATGGPVEVWVDEVQVVAGPLPGTGRLKPVVEEESILPSALLPNVPNPFNAETVLRYQVGASIPQRVVLRVYNLSGQVVRTLVEEAQAPGSYAVKWDGQDGQRRTVASGVYLSRLQVGAVTQTHKLLLLR